MFFKYKNHPGDLFRDTSIQSLPDFEKDKESFWIWFLPNYSTSKTVSYLNDLYKWVEDIHDGFVNSKFERQFGRMTLDEINEQIKCTEDRLDLESLMNFYKLINHQEIELFNL